MNIIHIEFVEENYYGDNRLIKNGQGESINAL